MEIKALLESDDALGDAITKYLNENQDGPITEQLAVIVSDWAMDSFTAGWDAALRYARPEMSQCPDCDGTGVVVIATGVPGIRANAEDIHGRCPSCTSPQRRER